MDYITWMIAAFIAALSLGFTWFCISVVVHTNQAHDEFMRECSAARPRYECTAMWRAGDRSVAVVPMIMPGR